MTRMKGYIFLLILFSLTACSTMKNVPEGDALYTGATIKVDGPSSLKAKQKKTLRSDLQTLTRPRPNTRFLGLLPIKLWMYNAMGQPKNENSFRGRLKYKFGEPPALLSDLDLDKNVKVLKSYLENKGYFQASVTGDTTVKNRKARATYTAQTGEQYTINAVQVSSDSSILTHKIAEASSKSLLKPGDAYDLDIIKSERNRIDAYLKENGFYYFSPDFLLMKVDSTIGDNKVNLYVSVKPDIPTAAKDLYAINDVFIYADYSLSTAEIDTSKANATLYEGYYIIDKDKKYKPWLFEHTMQFEPGEVYNRADHNTTLTRLINLNLFKYVKNRFEPASWLDTPKLNAYYYLTPMPKKSLRAEITGINKSNNSNGSEITFSWSNRNTFRGGEQLRLSAYVGTEIQFGGTYQGFNTYRTGAEGTITLPKFLMPFFDIRNEGAFAPRTVIQLGYDVLNKRKLYTLNSFRGKYGYTWKEDITKLHELFPVSINYVQPFNVTKTYLDTVKRYPTLAKATEEQFILGSSYRFNYDKSLKGLDYLNSFYFNGIADFSGNLASLIKPGDIKSGDTAKLFNAPYSQYVKFEADFRYYRKLGLKSSWANRIIMGYGQPYGNSYELPFVKQFFAGGNNSVRAFRSRNLGPGTFKDTSGLLIDQTGDLKLELNTEFRPHLSGPFYGAVFIDAGNIWLKNENPEKPGAKFTKDFLKQLAVGAGVGLRLDVTIFVIRFDVATPLRKPWEQNPWVMSNIDFSDRRWRKENIIFNLAIGYPF